MCLRWWCVTHTPRNNCCTFGSGRGEIQVMACEARAHEHTQTHTVGSHTKPAMHRYMHCLCIHTLINLSCTHTHTHTHLDIDTDEWQKQIHTHYLSYTHFHTHTLTDADRWRLFGSNAATAPPLYVSSPWRGGALPRETVFFFVFFLLAAETWDWVSSSQRWQITRPWQSNPDRIKRWTISQSWQPTAGRQTEDRWSLLGDKDTEMAEEIGDKVKEVPQAKLNRWDWNRLH